MQLLPGTAPISGTGNNLANTITGNDGNNTLTGGKRADTLLGGGGIDSLIGGDHNDTMDGGADNDTLNGGAGDDTYIGGAGDDIHVGGAGNDAFSFLANGFGHDTIQVFDANPAQGQDKIDLSGFGITADTFAAAVHKAGTTTTILTVLDIDTITLQGVSAATITPADFILA